MTVSLISKFKEAIEAVKLTPGDGIIIEDGIVSVNSDILDGLLDQWLEASTSSAYGGILWFKITGGGPGKEYTADVYESGRYNDDGTEKAADLTGETVYIVQIATNATVPTGTFLPGRKCSGHYEADLTSRWL